jgi:hypothetical protein
VGILPYQDKEEEGVMQKWEYYHIRTENPEEAIGDLNRLGLEGWELVAVVPIASHGRPIGIYAHELSFVFKRPKP